MSAPQWIINLQTRRDNVAAELAAMAPTRAGGLPNVGGEGVNTDHVGYRKSLWDELLSLRKLLSEAGYDDDDEDYVGLVETEEYP